MKRRNTLLLVYLGAWIASIELAAELLLPDTGLVTTAAARTAQALGLALAAWGAWQLRRALPHKETAPAGPVAEALRTERIMSAYTSEILTHLFMAGMVLSVALAYALVLYVRLLDTLPARWYYLGVIVTTFSALVAAWLLPVRDMLREQKRLDAAAEAPMG